jgi:hypothetical protein
LTKGLEGKLYPGQNAVSMEIKDQNSVVFLSEAGVAAGTSRGPTYQILQNGTAELAAAYFDGTSVNTFVLNKTNGLAIWAKVRSTFPGDDAPTGAQSYMVCQ